MNKYKQKQLLTEIMNEDAKDGLYHIGYVNKMVEHHIVESNKIINMTPKEKAEELVTKFQQSRDPEDYNDVRDIHAAIRCALIAVDLAMENDNDDFFNRYWLQVKQEIEKL